MSAVRPHSLFLEDVVFNSPACEVNVSGSTPIFPFGPGFFNEMPVSITAAALAPQKGELQVALGRMLGASPAQIVFSPGSSMALMQTLAALTRSGDTILVEDPHYEPFFAQARFLGLKVCLFKRTGDAEKDLRELKKKKRGVKLLLLTNPHAPMGKRYGKEYLKDLASLFPFMIVDEVFEPLFSTEGQLSTWRGDVPDNVVTLHSFSKAVGLSSIRLGVVRAPDEDLAHKIELHGNVFHIEMPTPSLLYALHVVNKWDIVMAAIESKVAPGRAYAQAHLQKHPKSLSHDFRHGFFGMMKAPAPMKTGKRFSQELLKHGFYVYPGDLFRLPGWVRFNLFMTPDQHEKFWGLVAT